METSNVIPLQVNPVKGEARVDSRLIAPELGIKHQSLIETIRRYQTELEQFGSLPFQTGARKRKTTGGVIEKYVLLNENQANFLMTLSRNTHQVVKLKMRIVAAFGRFREHQQTLEDYLPLHASFQQTVKELVDAAHEAGSTTPDQFFYANFNRLINSTFGLKSNERHAIPPGLRVYVTTAIALVQQVLQESLASGLNHKQAYALAKQRLIAYVNTIGIKSLLSQVE